MDATTTQALITDAVSDIGDVLSGALPTVIGLAALLLGAGYLWGVIRRKIQGRKF